MISSKCPGRAISLLAFLPILLGLPKVLSAQRAQENVQQAQENMIPLTNWSTPLHWHPNQAEREAAPKPLPLVQALADNLNFVAISPCRLVDTRGGAFDGVSPFSGPFIASGAIATFPVQSSTEASTNTMPAPCGVIPAAAVAYSFNVTVIPAAAGGVNYVTLWPAGGTQPVVSTLNDVQGTIVADAAIVPAGTPSGGVSLYNSGPAAINVVIDMNGYFAAGSGGAIAFADYFALMPPNNAATVAPGADVSFPQDGPTSGTIITQLTPTTFNLAAIGTYQILFQVSVSEAGQLILTLNGTDQSYTVVGRATTTSQIVGMSFVTTTLINSVLTVRNPSGNAVALTLTPMAGGGRPVSAHLLITQIQ